MKSRIFFTCTILHLFIAFLAPESKAQIPCISCVSVTEVMGSPFIASTEPNNVAFSPFLTQGPSAGSTLLAISNTSAGTIAVYTIAPNGTFSEVAFYIAGTEPAGIAFSQPLTEGPNVGGFLFAISTLNGVLVYPISPSGIFLTPTPYDVVTTDSIGLVAFSPALASGDFYLAIGSGSLAGQITLYSIDPTGTKFTLLVPSPSAGSAPNGVAFSPYLKQGSSSGGFLLAIANAGSSNVTSYSIDSTGKFSPATTLSSSTIPLSVAFSPLLPNNSFLLNIANEDDNTITIYSVSPSGSYSSPTTYTVGSGPVSVAFSPILANGTLLTAVSNQVDSTISLYSANALGTLTPICGSPFSMDLSTPSGLAFSPLLNNGSTLLATGNLGTDRVTVYSISTTSSNVSISINCTKRISPTDIISYTINVTNTGSTSANQVTVTSLLPACVTFAGAQAQGWTIAAIGQTVTATLPVSLAIGQTASFIISGQASCKQCQPISLIATVSASCAVPTTVSCTTCVC